MNFLDTSVLIAAARTTHPKHEQCLALLEHASPASTAIGAHSLAEAYSNFSGAFQPRPLPSTLTHVLLQDYVRRFTLIHLEADEVFTTVDACVYMGVKGGTVYDALLLACARKARATGIYTLNTRHFRHIAPDLSDLIREP